MRDTLNLYFWFNGRIIRWTYWWRAIPVLLILLVAYGMMVEGIAPLGAAAILLASGWVYCALTIKRLHDRGKSAWWTLTLFILLIIGVGWLSWECSKKGSYSRNRYGLSPEYLRDNE